MNNLTRIQKIAAPATVRSALAKATTSTQTLTPAGQLYRVQPTVGTGGSSGGVYNRVSYSPGLLQSINLTDPSYGVNKLAEAVGLANADIAVVMTLPAPTSPLIVVNNIIAAASGTFGGSLLNMRVYIDQQTPSNLMLEVAHHAGAFSLTNWYNNYHLTDCFNLLKDGKAHTFYFFMWVDALGDTDMLNLYLYLGVGSENNQFNPPDVSDSSADLEPGTNTIIAVAEAVGLVNADYSVTQTLSNPPPAPWAITNVTVEIAGTLDSMTGGGILHIRLYVDQQNPAHMIFQTNVNAPGGYGDNSNVMPQDALFSLLADGLPHTFYAFMWQNAPGDNPVISEVYINTYDSVTDPSVKQAILFNFNGLAQIFGMANDTTMPNPI